MKKTLAILLALLMVFGMAVACAKPSTTEAPKAEATAEPAAATEAPADSRGQDFQS